MHCIAFPLFFFSQVWIVEKCFTFEADHLYVDWELQKAKIWKSDNNDSYLNQKSHIVNDEFKFTSIFIVSCQNSILQEICSWQIR